MRSNVEIAATAGAVGLVAGLATAIGVAVLEINEAEKIDMQCGFLRCLFADGLIAPDPGGTQRCEARCNAIDAQLNARDWWKPWVAGTLAASATVAWMHYRG